MNAKLTLSLNQTVIAAAKTTIANNGTAKITRNIKDFKESTIPVMTAQEYLYKVKAN